MAPSNTAHGTEGSERATGVRDPRSRPRKTGSIRWLVGLVVRLCIWYSLLTPFFRCPSRLSDLTGSSPRVCKPYLYVRSYVEPHVLPYYDTYAAPYVETVRPYAHVLNEKVYTPASNIAKQSYDKYGAPALDQVQLYARQQWAVKVVPHLQSAKDSANEWYEDRVSPHVQKITTAVSPYQRKVNRIFRVTVDGYVLPFCAKYQPFIGKTYTSGQEILTTTVMPYAQNTWTSALYLINSTLWPRISSLYSENVEPQLVKIGQRLASYREGKRLRQVTDDVDSGSPSDYSVSSLASPVDSNRAETITSSSNVQATPSPTLSPTELAAQTREKITSDLKTWQKRFDVAAQKGVEELEARVHEIVTNDLAGSVKTDGENLLDALETAVEVQTSSVKGSINALTGSLPFEDAPKEEQAAIEELLKEVRHAAVSLRDRAHAVREWHNSFQEAIAQKVSSSVSSTLAVLDDIRDLGLQEIGMRWAWMEGVTYKDWEDYHALKAQVEDWKDQFRRIGLQHEKIQEAKALTENILFRGMDIAEAAAKELSKLREVGKWKIAAREVSEDFDTRADPPPLLPKRAQVFEEGGSYPEGADGLPAHDAENPLVLDNQVSDVPQGSPSGLSDEEALENVRERAQQSLHGPQHDGQTESPTVEQFGEGAWGAAAAEARFRPKSAHQKAVQDLLSELLADKEASYAENLLNKLHAIYADSQPSADSNEPEAKPSTSTSTQSTDTTNIPIDDVLESVDEQLQSAAIASFEDDYLINEDATEQEFPPTSDSSVAPDSFTSTFAPAEGEEIELDDTVLEPMDLTASSAYPESVTFSSSTLVSTATETVSLEQVVSDDITEQEISREDL